MLLDDYNEWIYSIAMPNVQDRCNHSKLLSKLNNIPFEYIIPMDINRYDDGIDLRYRYGAEEGYDNIVVQNEIDVRECSVLEMMVALALRCEENIMYNVELGFRPNKWFFKMLESLHLLHMTNINYNDNYVTDRINIFITRSYAYDGNGGLFTLNNPKEDMRGLEIWRQAMLYLTENYSE